MLVMTHQYGCMVCSLDLLASYVILNCSLRINMVVWYVRLIRSLRMLAQFARFSKRDRLDNRTGIAVWSLNGKAMMNDDECEQAIWYHMQALQLCMAKWSVPPGAREYSLAWAKKDILQCVTKWMAKNTVPIWLWGGRQKKLHLGTPHNHKVFVTIWGLTYTCTWILEPSVYLSSYEIKWRACVVAYSRNKLLASRAI